MVYDGVLPVSFEYRKNPKPSCLRLLRHFISVALLLALARAGSSNAARIAMIAITTSNSISVKPPRCTLALDLFVTNSIKTQLNFTR